MGIAKTAGSPNTDHPSLKALATQIDGGNEGAKSQRFFLHSDVHWQHSSDPVLRFSAIAVRTMESLRSELAEVHPNVDGAPDPVWNVLRDYLEQPSDRSAKQLMRVVDEQLLVAQFEFRSQRDSQAEKHHKTIGLSDIAVASAHSRTVTEPTEEDHVPTAQSELLRVLELDWYDGISAGLFQIRSRQVAHWYLADRCGTASDHRSTMYQLWQLNFGDQLFDPQPAMICHHEVGLDEESHEILLTKTTFKFVGFLTINSEYSGIVDSFKQIDTTIGDPLALLKRGG